MTQKKLPSQKAKQPKRTTQRLREPAVDQVPEQVDEAVAQAQLRTKKNAHRVKRLFGGGN